MKLFPSVNKIRAAHSLSQAMTDGTLPDAKSLEILGLEQKLARRFKR